MPENDPAPEGLPLVLSFRTFIGIGIGLALQEGYSPPEICAVLRALADNEASMLAAQRVGPACVAIGRKALDEAELEVAIRSVLPKVPGVSS